MNSKFDIIRDSYSALFILALFLMLSPVLTMRITFLLTHDITLLSNWKLTLLFGVIIIFSILVLKGKQTLNYKEIILSFGIIFTFTIQWLITININDTEGIQSITQIISRYAWAYVICFAFIFKPKNFNVNLIIKFTILFALGNASLGIAQYVLKNPLLSISYNGNYIVNAIFYSNGASSSSELFRQVYDSKVRAFGFFDSGMALGFFLIIALCLILSLSRRKNPTLKLTLSLIVLFAIYFTLTRNIYLTLFNMMLFKFLFSRKNGITKVKRLFILEWIISIFYVIGAKYIYGTLTSLFPSYNFSTMLSRIDTYQRLEIIQPDNPILHFLFGNGILPSDKLIIDNDLLSIINHVGVLPYIALQSLIIYILVKGMKFISYNKESNNYPYVKWLTIFLLTYPLASMLNFVIPFYLFAGFLILIFISNDTSKR